MRLIDEIAYQEKIAKIPIEERTFVKAWETAQDMPTIDAAPVVRGEWINKPKTCVFICSMCGREVKTFHTNDIKAVNDEYPFCHCGAKMEGKQDE